MFLSWLKRLILAKAASSFRSWTKALMTRMPLTASWTWSVRSEKALCLAKNFRCMILP